MQRSTYTGFSKWQGSSQFGLRGGGSATLRHPPGNAGTGGDPDSGYILNSPDVIVIGGGPIGLGVAWRAAARGLRVTVLDKNPVSGAASVAAGMLAPVTEVHPGEEDLLRLNLVSSELFPEWVEELEGASGIPTGYRPCGTLMVARDTDDRVALDDVFSFQRRLGLSSQRLSAGECRALEPGLAPSVRGGLLVEGDHQVDPAALGRSLFEACDRAGVRFVRTNVESLLLEGERTSGVVLADGSSVLGSWVVVAAGAWSGGLGIGRELLPIRPVKGQVVRLKGRPGMTLPSHNLRGLDIYVVTRADGRVVLGATVEEQGFDPEVTADGVYRLLDEAYRIFPGIVEAGWEGAAASFRPGTPDNAPLIGLTAIDGLISATGHYRNGILLTPVTADTVSHLLATGEVSPSIAPFSPRRFEDGWHRVVPGPTPAALR